MWKVLLNEWARLSTETSQSILNKNILESYRQEDVLSFYQKYIPKNEWVFLGLCAVLGFWIVSQYDFGARHLFAFFAIGSIIYLYGRTQVRTFTESLELTDTELRFLNSILFTDRTADWQSQAAALPENDKSFSSPLPANKSYLYLYPVASRFYYEQRYLIYLHFGGYRDSLRRMNQVLQHWDALKRSTELRIVQANYEWFLTDCTKCVNHFAEIYEGLLLNTDTQTNYQTALRQLQEIIQGLREDAKDYLQQVLEEKTEINTEWFPVLTNDFPMPNDAEAPDCDPSHSYIPNQ